MNPILEFFCNIMIIFGGIVSVIGLAVLTLFIFAAVVSFIANGAPNNTEGQ